MHVSGLEMTFWNSSIMVLHGFASLGPIDPGSDCYWELNKLDNVTHRISARFPPRLSLGGPKN